MSKFEYKENVREYFNELIEDINWNKMVVEKYNVLLDKIDFDRLNDYEIVDKDDIGVYLVEVLGNKFDNIFIDDLLNDIGNDFENRLKI